MSEDELRAAILKFGRHIDGCEVRYAGRPCSCGWQAVLFALHGDAQQWSAKEGG